MLPIETIIVPVDFSESSGRALDYAIELAQQFGASLHVVHASDLPRTIPAPDEWTRAVREEIASGLERSVQEATRAGLKAESHLSDELPWEAIAKLAEEVDADLIVMSSHGRTGLAHAFLGSVAERTLRLAPCPVLVVKAE